MKLRSASTDNRLWGSKIELGQTHMQTDKQTLMRTAIDVLL